MNRAMQAAAGTVLMGAALFSASRAAARSDTLDRELAAVAANARMPLASLSVLAIRGGEITYQQQFGLRRMGGVPGMPSAPADAATMYRIASISKMMTTLGLMRLVEAGQFDLDADVGDYLGYPLRNPHFPDRPISLRALLTHTSSLRDGAGYSWGAQVAIAERLGSGDPAMWSAEAAPGAYFTYCNLNWGVIGTAMEKVTGERFDRLMRRLLLQPLGLRGGYNPAEFSAAELDSVATLYRKREPDSEHWDGGGPWIAQVDDYGSKPPAAPAGVDHYVIGSNGTLFSPTGGLRISAADLGKVMLMLINGGSYQGQRILRPETVALMFSRQWHYSGGNGDTLHGLYRSWGLGSQRFEASADGALPNSGVVEDAGFSAVGHLGEAYGLVSAFVVDLEHGNGMVALTGGTGADPEADTGRYSALPRFEERILSALYRHAILGDSK